MTNTSSSTGAAEGPETYESVPDIGFSVEELQYLLSIRPGAAADMSADVLNVGPVGTVDDTILVGGAALLARGQLEFVPEHGFKPIDAALVLAYVLTNAERWTIISGATEDSADAGIYVEAADGAILAQPRTLGTWWFVILDPAVPSAEILVGTVMGMADAAEEAGVLVQTRTADDDRTFSVRRRGTDWAYAYGPTGSATPEAQVDNAAMSDIVAKLASFIAHFPGNR